MQYFYMLKEIGIDFNNYDNYKTLKRMDKLTGYHPLSEDDDDTGEEDESSGTQNIGLQEPGPEKGDRPPQ